VQLGGSLAGDIGTLRHGQGSTGMEVGRISAAAGVDTALKQNDTGGFGFGGIESTGQVSNPMRGWCPATPRTLLANAGWVPIGSTPGR
jgi:hypothetical protein